MLTTQRMRFDRAWPSIEPLTLLGWDRAAALFREAERAREWEGAVVEFGTYKGGSALLLYEATGRVVDCYDTFCGYPGVGGPYHPNDFMDATPESTSAVLGGRARLHVGDLLMLPEEPLPYPIAFAHVDVDQYAPTRQALIMAQLSPVIVVDDYMLYPGARDAIMEFVGTHGREWRLRTTVSESAPQAVLEWT